MSSSSGAHDGHDDIHEEHEEHVNHEAWVIPYADLLTLLMAMFIALFAISSVDVEKFKKLAESLNDAFGGGRSVAVLADGGGIVGDGGATPIVDDPFSPEAALATLRRLDERVRAAEEASRLELSGVEDAIRSQAVAVGMDSNLSFRIEERGLVVSVLTDQVLFASGSASLTPAGEQLLAVLGDPLRSVPNQVQVEGHTDDVPIATAAFPSNWELSTARAGAVVRFFEQRLGLPSGRLTATGYGEQRPVDTNTTNAGRARNRRVEVVVMSTMAETSTLLLKEAVTAAERLDRSTPDLARTPATPDGAPAPTHHPEQ